MKIVLASLCLCSIIGYSTQSSSPAVPSSPRSAGATSRAGERQLYYTPESYGKINHKNHQPASYAFSFPPSEVASVPHPDFSTPPSSLTVAPPPQNETESETGETGDLNHHQSHVEESILSPHPPRRSTTEAPVVTLPKPPDFVELFASTTTPSPPAAPTANSDRWIPRLKPYDGESASRKYNQPSRPSPLTGSGKKDAVDEGYEETDFAVRGGGGRGSAITSSDQRFEYSSPAAAYSADFYQNFTKDPIDWSALLLNYTKSNENFNATSFHELTHAYRPTPDTSSLSYASPPASQPATPPNTSHKRRRYRPKVSPASTTSTSTSTTTTSTTRPPKIYLQPTIDAEDDEEDDPPRNIYGDAGGDVEASESSHGADSGADQEEGKESEADDTDRYNYPVISSAKSRTKGNYIRRPYNYHDLVSTSSHPSSDYYFSSGNSNQNGKPANPVHRHQLHAGSSADEEDESAAKYAMIRHYDPHRFASSSSLYPGYYHHAASPSIASDGGGGGEEGYYPSYGYTGGGGPEESIHRHEAPSRSPAGSLSSWSGLTGFLLGIIPLSLIVASLAPAFVSVPVASIAGRRRRRRSADNSAPPEPRELTVFLQRLLDAQRKYG